MSKKTNTLLYILLMGFCLANVSEENVFLVNASYVMSAATIFALAGAKDIKLKPIMRWLVCIIIFIIGVLVIPTSFA